MYEKLSALLIGLLIAGCGYTSQYVPPADGRARPLWDDDHLTNNLSSFGRPPGCDDLIKRSQYPELQLRADLVPTVWVPRYYGADIVVVTPGVPPILPRPVLFSPSLTLIETAAHAARSSGGGGGGGGSSSNLGKEVLVVLLVIAIVVSPIIDVTLASVRAESDNLSADAIDQANAYNDLARSFGNPCAQF